MAIVEGDKVETPIWNVYSKIIKKYDNRGNDVIQNIERYDFYEQAKKSYAISCYWRKGPLCKYYITKRGSSRLVNVGGILNG